MLRTAIWLLSVAILSCLGGVVRAGDLGDPAISPGQEETIARIVGRGMEFPDGCRFVGGEVDHLVIVARYDCPGGEVVFELVHPSQTDEAVAQTEQFALTIRSGTPPSSLQSALLAAIREGEGDFEWSWPAADDDLLEDTDAVEDE